MRGEIPRRLDQGVRRVKACARTASDRPRSGSSAIVLVDLSY